MAALLPQLLLNVALAGLLGQHLGGDIVKAGEHYLPLDHVALVSLCLLDGGHRAADDLGLVVALTHHILGGSDLGQGVKPALGAPAAALEHYAGFVNRAVRLDLYLGGVLKSQLREESRPVFILADMLGLFLRLRLVLLFEEFRGGGVALVEWLYRRRAFRLLRLLYRRRLGDILGHYDRLYLK